MRMASLSSPLISLHGANNLSQPDTFLLREGGVCIQDAVFLKMFNLATGI